MLSWLLLSACGAPDVAAIPLNPGSWRAWLHSPGGELPFGLELGEESGTYRATVINGPERIEVPSVSVSARALTLGFDHYNAVITAQLSEDGQSAQGEWRKEKRGGAVDVLPFSATAGEGPRFSGAQGFDPTGRWRVQFSSDERDSVGLFGRADGAITGTFLTPLGDYRYLAGETAADTLSLSCFDGSHAFLFRATRQDDGTLAGDFWSGGSWHETWSAEPDPKAHLADPYRLSQARPVEWTAVRYPDLEGRMRSPGDAEFTGKVRIIELFGSWCPNCHDAAPVLADLHRKYADQGLAVIGLAFEHTGDVVRDTAQIRRYAARHNIDFPLWLAGSSDKQKASQVVPFLEKVIAYPTTVFVDRSGQIRAVHTGFAGPATGEAYHRLIERFEAEIEALLAEPA